MIECHRQTQLDARPAAVSESGFVSLSRLRQPAQRVVDPAQIVAGVLLSRIELAGPPARLFGLVVLFLRDVGHAEQLPCLRAWPLARQPGEGSLSGRKIAPAEGIQTLP